MNGDFVGAGEGGAEIVGEAGGDFRVGEDVEEDGANGGGCGFDGGAEDLEDVLGEVVDVVGEVEAGGGGEEVGEDVFVLFAAVCKAAVLWGGGG